MLCCIAALSQPSFVATGSATVGCRRVLKESPSFVVSREAWDETSHRVAVKLETDLPERMQASTWHVMVSRMSRV
jgi:hypothetical protein